MERLDFGEETVYSAVEASIHLNRYVMAKKLCKGKRVLDAACGEGYGSFLMRKWGAEQVYGLDIDEETIKKANKLFASPQVKFQCNTVEQLPFPDCYFDLIVSFETLEHLDHPEKFLNEIRRVIRPGGGVIVSCPNDPYYYRDDTKISNPFHKKQYTFFDFKELVEKYLGDNVDYFLAFAVNGFMSMPISRSTEPSNAKTDNMLEMMNYIECENALCVKQERYLNHWNSNYYVGVWGGNEIRKNINTVIFPRETFAEIKDSDIELLNEVKRWKVNEEGERAKLEEKLKIAKLKEERLSAMTELLNEEIECLQQSYDKRDLKSKKIESELKNVYEKQKQLLEENNLAIAELNGIKRSKGWKLLMMLYRIEGIFRKK